MNLDNLKKQYAELIVNKGVNIQKGQRLLINSPVECADFARACAEAAYKNGCREVVMSWSDDALTRMRFMYAEDSVFDKMNEWDALQKNALGEEGCAVISIYAEDPENLKGVDSERVDRWQKTRGAAQDVYYKHMTRNDYQWNVVSVPTDKWAMAVFPNLPKDEAVEKLWVEILSASRADKEGALEAWTKHTDELQTNLKKLNEYNFKYLKYKNSLGTDFTAELPEDHYWAGGEETSTKGVKFSANIPTEEIFTLPKKDSINGKIVASKPLCINGNIIDGFYFIVKDGKIVDLHADQGEEILRKAIAVDEGACYFGELALVPYDSPISNSGILFLNTLFDENASCHLAFGEAYPCIKGSENMSDDELKARGVNYSITHEDFMIGTADLSIIGITHDGKEVPVFVNGNFAI